MDGGAEAPIARATGRQARRIFAPGYTISGDPRSSTRSRRAQRRLRLVGLPVPAVLPGERSCRGDGARCASASGRTSRSILDSPRVLTAPRHPYRPGRRWDSPSAAARRFVELPIQVTPGLRGCRLLRDAHRPRQGGGGARAGVACARASRSTSNLELHLDRLPRRERRARRAGRAPAGAAGAAREAPRGAGGRARRARGGGVRVRGAAGSGDPLDPQAYATSPPGRHLQGAAALRRCRPPFRSAARRPAAGEHRERRPGRRRRRPHQPLRRRAHRQLRRPDPLRDEAPRGAQARAPALDLPQRRPHLRVRLRPLGDRRPPGPRRRRQPVGHGPPLRHAAPCARGTPPVPVYHAYRWDVLYSTRINSLGIRAMSRFGDVHAGFDVATNLGTTREIAAAYNVISNDPAATTSRCKSVGARAVVRATTSRSSPLPEGDQPPAAIPRRAPPHPVPPSPRTPTPGCSSSSRSSPSRARRRPGSPRQAAQRPEPPRRAIATRGAFTNAMAFFQVDVHPRATCSCAAA